jgi:hypothetical protein
MVKPKQQKKQRAPAVPLLFVCAPSGEADETAAMLEARGMLITRADNVCYAEMYADTQHFKAAVYDQSLSQEEQASLARVMRIRWPWMRILRWVAGSDPFFEDELYDWSVRTQAELAHCVDLRLSS